MTEEELEMFVTSFLDNQPEEEQSLFKVTMRILNNDVCSLQQE